MSSFILKRKSELAELSHLNNTHFQNSKAYYHMLNKYLNTILYHIQNRFEIKTTLD